MCQVSVSKTIPAIVPSLFDILFKPKPAIFCPTYVVVVLSDDTDLSLCAADRTSVATVGSPTKTQPVSSDTGWFTLGSDPTPALSARRPSLIPRV